MASTVQHVSNCVYIVIRLKMAEESNGLVGSNLYRHYGEINGVFLIGGLVPTGKTLMASAIRHCRNMVRFRFTRKI